MTASLAADLSAFVRNPVGQVILLFIALTITYIALVRLIRVSVPPPREASAWYEEALREEEDTDGGEADDAGDTPAAEPDDELVPEYYRPEPPTPSMARKEIAAAEQPQPVAPVTVVVEALTVGGVRIAVGDTSSAVMRAFRPGQPQPAPLIERGAGERAWHVTRFYEVNGRPLTLQFQRLSIQDPLRLSSIKLEAGS